MGDGRHADQLFDGRAFRILTVVDCHTRESLAIVPRVSVRAYQVVEALDEIAKACGRPKSLRAECLNASRFLSIADARERIKDWKERLQ